MLMRVPVVAGVLATLLAGMVVYDADASIRRRRGPKEGCPSEYTEINSIEELAAITAAGNYCLMRTLDFQDDNSYDDPILNKATYTTGEGWEPLYPIHHTVGGRLGDLFGLGNEIRNLYINRPATENVGLFGAMRGGTVKDLTFRDVNIDGGGYTGTLIGRVSTAQPIIIDNIQVINAQLETHLETNDGGRLGGLVGQANGMSAAYYLQVSNILIENATIKDETSRIGATQNGENLGGIFGFVTIHHTQAQTLLRNALVKDSSITSLNNGLVGGVIGGFTNVRINRVVVDNTTVYGGDQYTGGFAGLGTQPGVTASIVDIQECGVLDTVNVTGVSFVGFGWPAVGGFIGRCCATGAEYPNTIVRNFSRAVVERVPPTNHAGAGGFYGFRGSGSGCVDCYYKGTITALGVGDNRQYAGAGGFVGAVSSHSGLTANTYADATIIYDLYKGCTQDWHCGTDQDCRWGQCMPIRYDQWGMHQSVDIDTTASFGARELPRGAITERVTTSNVTPVYRDNEPGGLYDMSIYVAANWNIVAVEPGTRNTNYIWNMVDGVDSPFLSWAGNPLGDPAVLDSENSIMVSSETRLAPDGVSTATITVQARDQYSRDWPEGGATVILNTTAGSLSAITDNDDGTYTTTFTAADYPAYAFITGTFNAAPITNSIEIEITELPLTDNLLVHYDPSYLGTLTLDSSNRVEQFNDAWSGEHHAAQATEADRPYIVEFEGLNWLDFSQDNHFLTALGEPSLPSGRTVLAVFYLPSMEHTGAVRTMMEQYPDPNTLSLSINSDDNLQHAIVDTEQRTAVTSAPTLTRQLVIGVWDDDGEVQIFTNLFDVHDTTSIGNITLENQDGWRLGVAASGDAGWFNGYLGEMTIYETALNESDRLLMAEHLVYKWIGAAEPSVIYTPITAAPTSIEADGETTSTITVDVRNQYDTDWTTGGDTVTLATTAGSLSIVTDNEDGTYTATLTSSTSEATAAITGTINGQPISDSAEVLFLVPKYLFSWGLNSLGRTAQGTTSGETVTPTQVGSGEPEWTDLHINMAVKIDGTLWQWGSLGYSKTCNNSTTTTPTQVGSTTDWLSVHCGADHSHMIKQDGTLWACGRGTAYQTGTGSTAQLNSPAQIGTSQWEMVSAGVDHSMGIQQDGTLWAWGSNAYGKTGRGGTTGNTTTPIQVGTATNWVSISADFRHSLGIRSDGTLWSWGTNSNGRTGQNTTIGNTTTPTQVGTATNWVAAAAFTEYSIGLRSDGTLWGWGVNTLGANGTGAQRIVPTQIGSDTDWAAIKENVSSIGNNHTFAIKSDGTLWAWGGGAYYKSGFSDTTNRSSPTKVGIAEGWTTAIPSAGHGVALYAGEFVPNEEATTLTAVPTSIKADGETTSTITVQVKDQFNRNWTTGGDTVTLDTTAGSLSSVTDNEDGTYTAILTSSEINELATITGTLNGVAITDTAEVKFIELDPTQTTITAEPTGIVADGETTSTITVQIVDIDGDAFNTGGDTVTLDNTAGSLSSVTDNEDGTYTATLTSSETPETATITGTLNGVAITDTAEVEFTAP